LSLDYRDFDPKLKKKKQEEQGETINKQWWKLEGEERSNSITAVAKQICDNDTLRQARYVNCMRLYGNVNPVGAMGAGFSKTPLPSIPIRERLTYNVIQAGGDSVIAKMCKNKPKAMFLTSGGNAKLQRKAKKADKFVDGVFYENNAYDMGTAALLDAYVFGNGMTQVFAQDDRVKHDRVLPGELFVDWEESKYGNPRQLHRVKEYDRDVLVAMFPKMETAIRAAQNYSTNMLSRSETLSDLLLVAESWRLPSSRKATDGMHCITIMGDKELTSEPWTKEYFPFANLPWTKPQIGYWAEGGASQIQSIQLEINKILWTIQRSYQLHGGTKLWIKIGSKIVKETITNEPGAIWEGEEKPEYIIPPIVPPEMYQALKDRKNDAFEQLGISQLSAISQKPAGVDSGKAMRTLNDIESERFMILGQAYEHYFLQLTRLDLDCAREIAAKNKGAGYKVKSPNSKLFEEIDWKDIDLDDEDFILQMFPISSLSTDPADRRQDVQEMVQAGWISPRTAKRLMSFPDIEAQETLDDAKEDYLHMIIEKMIYDGEYTAPEPFDDLALAKDLFLDYYAWAKVNNVEESNLELLRNFSDQVDLLVQKATPPAPTAPGGPSPQANPMAPPQSDLLQNTPTAA
jgi:hypothetical protein